MPSCSSGLFNLDVATVALCESSVMQQCRLLPWIFLVMSMTSAFSAVGAQGMWTTAQLSEARFFLAAASFGNVALFAGGTNNAAGYSGAVDVFNANTRAWSTTQLSVVRFALTAASVEN